MLQYHKNNVVQAILDLFPEIGLDKTKFYMCMELFFVNMHV